MAGHRDLSIWLVQIERFLAHGNHLDAIARARRLVEEARRLQAESPEDVQAAQFIALGEARLREATRLFEEQNRDLSGRRLATLRSTQEG